MKNIHITITEFRNESRVLKEISSLEAAGIFSRFCVIALGAVDLKSEEKISQNVQVYRIRLRTRGLPKSAPFQFFKFIEFMIAAFLLARRTKADVVNLHTLALLPLGWLLKKLLSVRLVYDAHELETEKNGLQGIRKKISKLIERRFIKTCDLVVVVGENIADWYANTYKIERPLVVKNAPFYVGRKKNDLFREALGIQPQQKILLYQGGLVRGRGIHLVLEAFKVRLNDGVVAIFMGYGDLVQEIQEAAQANKNIYYYPAVAPSIVLNYTSSADIGISLIENTCLSYYYCMPNKLFEYAMAGLPVIVTNMKEMAGTVIGAEFGVVLQDLSVDSINRAIDSLISQDLSAMSENAYAFASTHSWEQQEAIMLQGYRRLLNV